MWNRSVNPAVAHFANKGLVNRDDAARVAMDADGNFYSGPPRDEFKAAMGMGHLDLGYLSSPANRPQRVGTQASKQRLGMMARHGVEMGPFWNEVVDLNRGRRTTGAAPEHDPVGALAPAARAAGGAANQMIFEQMMSGLNRARGGR